MLVVDMKFMPDSVVTSSLPQADSSKTLPAWSSAYLSTLSSLEIGAGDLDAFLFDDEKEALEHIAKDMRDVRDVPAGKKARENLTVDHLQAYQEEGLSWPPNMPPAFAARCEHLPERQREVAFFQACRHRGQSGQDNTGETVHDLNYNIDWKSGMLMLCPTIVCSSSLWLRIRMRSVCGEEALRLQGFPRKLAALTSDMSMGMTQKMELAGNSFNGLVVAAVFVAMFKDVIPVVARNREPAAPSEATAAELSGVEAEDVEAEGSFADEVATISDSNIDIDDSSDNDNE